MLLYVHRESHVQKTVHVPTVAVPAGSASHPTPLLPGSCLQSDYNATDGVDQALWQRTGSGKDIGSHHLEKTTAFITWKRRRHSTPGKDDGIQHLEKTTAFITWKRRRQSSPGNDDDIQHLEKTTAFITWKRRRQSSPGNDDDIQHLEKTTAFITRTGTGRTV